MRARVSGGRLRTAVAQRQNKRRDATRTFLKSGAAVAPSTKPSASVSCSRKSAMYRSYSPAVSGGKPSSGGAAVTAPPPPPPPSWGLVFGLSSAVDGGVVAVAAAAAGASSSPLPPPPSSGDTGSRYDVGTAPPIVGKCASTTSDQSPSFLRSTRSVPCVHGSCHAATGDGWYACFARCVAPRRRLRSASSALAASASAAGAGAAAPRRRSRGDRRRHRPCRRRPRRG